MTHELFDLEQTRKGPTRQTECSRPLRIVHIITSLETGGAQSVLYRLCLADRIDDHAVVSLNRHEPFAERLEAAGIRVHRLDARPGIGAFASLPRLRALLRAERPDVVQTWMYHADLLGGLAARAAGIRRVSWGIRHSNFDPAHTSRSTLRVVRLCAALSAKIPARIVSCAETAVKIHHDIGYDTSRFTVIQNGIDTAKFHPLEGARSELRRMLGLPDDGPVIGCVARYHPQKGHDILLQAFARVAKSDHDVTCLLIGSGLTPSNAPLVARIEELGLTGRMQLLGERDDIPFLMAALDLHVLASIDGEGFPNVVAEAMACGTPNVATEVGDARAIVGDCGWTARPNDEEDLARKIETALIEVRSDGIAARRLACHRRITDEFGIERMVGKYRTVWNDLVEPVRP